MGKKIDLTGQRFGILTVIRKVGTETMERKDGNKIYDSV